MSVSVTQPGSLPPDDPEAEGALGRYLLLQKAGGLVAPLVTALAAFLIAGVVVFACIAIDDHHERRIGRR